MNVYLLPALDAGPIVIRRLMRQIAPERWDEALAAGRFTPREVLAHLADWEPILRERIATAQQSPGALLTAYDEEAMAREHGYATSDPWEQCDRFTQERRLTIEFVRGLAPEDWPKAAHHPERGPQSVEDLANLLSGHDLYHIEQLSTYLEAER